jgi:hypothetical protein
MAMMSKRFVRERRAIRQHYSEVPPEENAQPAQMRIRKVGNGPDLSNRQ